MKRNPNWTEEELKMAINVYCKIPFILYRSHPYRPCDVHEEHGILLLCNADIAYGINELQHRVKERIFGRGFHI